MNDSFLEELELVPAQKPGSVVHHAERYITSRRSQSPSTRLHLERDELEAFIKQQIKSTSSPVSTVSPMSKISNRKSVEEITSPTTSHPKVYVPSPVESQSRRKTDSKDKKNEPKKQIKEVKHVSSKSKYSEKKISTNEEKLKPVENVERYESVKQSLSTKERTKKPSASRESSKLSDGSSKENSRPSDSSEEINPEATTEWKRVSADSTKRRDEICDDKGSVVMLNAIKEIVSGYTKAESSKVMKMMQDLYINSQTSLIKQLLIMNDDLRDLLPSKDSAKVQSLMQENEQLKNNITFLRSKIDELKKVADTVDKVRQENLTLKKRVWELEK